MKHYGYENEIPDARQRSSGNYLVILALPSKFGKAKYGESRSPVKTALKKRLRRAAKKTARAQAKAFIREIENDSDF
jgi:hypothetical protein